MSMAFEGNNSFYYNNNRVNEVLNNSEINDNENALIVRNKTFKRLVNNLV